MLTVRPKFPLENKVERSALFIKSHILLLDLPPPMLENLTPSCEPREPKYCLERRCALKSLPQLSIWILVCCAQHISVDNAIPKNGYDTNDVRAQIPRAPRSLKG